MFSTFLYILSIITAKMKRNFDLMKAMLIHIEEKTSLNNPILIDIEGFSKDEINYNLQLLMDADYIDAQILGYGRVLPRRLTNSGHDFLDVARNDTVWNNTKTTIKEKGATVTLEIFKSLLSAGTQALFTGLQ